MIMLLWALLAADPTSIPATPMPWYGKIDEVTGRAEAFPRFEYGWIVAEDYPKWAKNRHIQGVVGFTASVDASGKLVDCTINQSSGNNDLDTATCELISRRARFAPARDKLGNPVEGTYSHKVNWVYRGKVAASSSAQPSLPAAPADP